MKRVLTALLLIPGVVGLIFWGPPLAVRATLALVALLCLHECLALIRAGGVHPFSIAAYGAGAVLVLAPSAPQPALLIGLAMLLLALSVQRVGSGRAAESFPAAAATLFVVIYACGPFVLAGRLHGLSPHWMFVVLLVNWVGDSTAYFVGRAIGRRPLAPVVSPKKTWEGTIASVVLGTAAGAAYLLHFLPDVSPALAVGLCLAINVTGQLGDLAESAFKRGVGVKDSGTLLPGHGGMLDRMDSALFSFPALVWLLTIVGRL